MRPTVTRADRLMEPSTAVNVERLETRHPPLITSDLPIVA